MSSEEKRMQGSILPGFSLGPRSVGSGSACLIIAEVAQSHEGSLGMAHAFIDAIADSGADAVKFQTHFAEEESSPEDTWRIKFSTQDASRYDYWKRMEFTKSQWEELKDHADSRGLIFLSSPFSIKAIELLLSLGITGWKVASGEIFDSRIMSCLQETRLPLIISSGMSTFTEIADLHDLLSLNDYPHGILQCTTSYPCPPEKIGLNILERYIDEFDCPVGLSDHSATIFPGLVAVAKGASIIEVHVTFDKKLFGPDVSSSLTFTELGQLVKGIRFTETMNNNPVNKDILSEELQNLRKLFSKSIYAGRDLSAGQKISDADLVLKKPGTGITSAEINKIIGRKLKSEVRKGRPLSMDDLY